MVVFFAAYGVGRQAILQPQAQGSWKVLRGMSYMPFLQIFGELQVEKFEGKSKIFQQIFSNDLLFICNCMRLIVS